MYQQSQVPDDSAEPKKHESVPQRACASVPGMLSFCSQQAHAGSGTISADEFEAFLTTLGPPLGLPADATNTQVYKLAADLDIPLVDGRVIFLRALYELIRSAVYYPLPVSAASYHLECCINKNFGFKV